MSDQTYRTLLTQGMEHVQLNCKIVGNTTGTNPPLFVEGDIPGVQGAATSVGNYLVIQRTSQGIYTITTTVPWLAVVGADCNMALPAAVVANTTGCQYAPVEAQNTVAQYGGPINSWTFTLNVYAAGAATELLSTQYVYLQFTMRNMITTP